MPITSDLSLFIRHMPFACVYQKLVADKNGRGLDCAFLEVNQEFRRIFGLPEGPLEGKRMFEVLPKMRDVCSWEDVFAEIADGKASKAFRFQGGVENRHYDTTIASTSPGFFVAAFRDISDDVEKSQRLKKQKSEIESLSRDLEIIFDNTPEALFLMELLDGKYKYIRTNLAHQRLTGLTPDEIRGKTPVQLLGPTIGGAMEEHIRMATETPEGVSYNDIMSLPIVRGRYFLNRLVPVEQNGHVRYIIGSRADITEIRQLTFEKEELARSIFSVFNENSAMVLILEAGTLRVISVNPSACRFFGVTEDGAASLCARDLFLLPEKKFRELSQVGPGKPSPSFIAGFITKKSVARKIEIFTSPVIYQGRSSVCCIMFDVTEREKIREELTRERNLLSVTLDSIGDGVVAVDKRGAISMLNREAARLTGWNEDKAVGRPFYDVFRLKHDKTGEPVLSPIESVLENKEAALLSSHALIVPKGGRAIPISDSASPIMDESGRLYGAVMVFRDVSRDREREEQITYLSYHDALTRLYNRRFAETGIKRLDTERNLPFSVIMGDVNGLKLTNDIFGHPAGDSLLAAVSAVMRQCCGNAGIPTRWGGDEFLILMPGADEAKASAMMMKIDEAFALANDAGRPISVSFGCATKRNKNENIQKTIQRADKRMYHNKLTRSKAYRMAIIGMLPVLMDEKIHEMKGHCDRLKKLCDRMEKIANLPNEEMKKLLLLCEAHDVGMVGVRKEILYKKEPLTADEMEEIREHASIGYRIAQGAPELQPIAEYIFCHHEQWDGGGYPRGVSGLDIPRLVRIFSVVNFYDSYAFGFGNIPAIGEKAAFDATVRRAGSEFDPEIVEIFVAAMKDDVRR